MQRKTHPGSNYSYVIDNTKPHLGGNIHGGDPNCWTPQLWDWLIERFDVKTMLDVGCGEGHTIKYFISKKCIGLGIEGLQENIDNAVLDEIVLHDITKASFEIGVDLVNIKRFYNLHNLDSFLDKYFTNDEKKYCSTRSNKLECFAGKYAAKEAIIKALYGYRIKINISDVEIQNELNIPRAFIKKIYESHI